jgi:uncharacterized Zn-finger protein
MRVFDSCLALSQTKGEAPKSLHRRLRSRRRRLNSAPMSNPGTEQASAAATETEDAVVACDGEGALGHPRVFLNLGKQAAIDCPYCGRRFTRKSGAGSGRH